MGTRVGKELCRRIKRKCYVCKTRKNLEIHHIIPRKIGGMDLEENLVFLCEDHHKELHRYFTRPHRKCINPTDRDWENKLKRMREQFETLEKPVS